MNSVLCPRCGAANEPNAAFCGVCGSPLAAQPAAPPAGGPPAGWQPPAASQPPPPNAYPPPLPNANFQPPPGGYQAPPPGAIPAPPGLQPPPGAYPPPPPGAYPPPPGGFPPGYPYPKIVGNNTKWALGLGIASVFCCGPFTSVPGIFMAKKDMDEIAAGRAPQLNEGWAKGAFYLNVISLVLTVLAIVFWFGMGGLHRF